MAGGHKIIRGVKAFCTEVVEVTWFLRDGSVFHTRHACPPSATIKAQMSMAPRSNDDEAIKVAAGGDQLAGVRGDVRR